MHKQSGLAIMIGMLLILSTAFYAIPLPSAFAQETEDVEFAANLEYIRGHLAQAVANKQVGNNTLAVAHAGHPVEEVYTLIQGELEEHDPAVNTKLDNAMVTLANQMRDLSPPEVQTRVTEINGMLDQARALVIDKSKSDDPKFNAMVAITLLETSEGEYEEAGVEGGKITQIVEYQDATAFMARSEAIFDSIKSNISEHSADELAEFYGNLDSLTKSKASFKEVETAIDGIVHEYEEALGISDATTEEKLDGWGYIDNIDKLLDQSVAEYKQGNAQEAEALAVEAYLDNYENIESDIAQDNQQLMTKIELAMREDLVNMIKQGRPAADIESHVAQIKTDLETARAVVAPEFPVAEIVMALLVAVIVAAGRFGGALQRRAGANRILGSGAIGSSSY